jgi:hypothetical protein
MMLLNRREIGQQLSPFPGFLIRMQSRAHPHLFLAKCMLWGGQLVLCPLSSFTLLEATPGSGRGLLPTSPEERGPTVALSSRKAGTDHGTVAGLGHSHGNSGRFPLGKGRKGRFERCGGGQSPAGAHRLT